MTYDSKKIILIRGPLGVGKTTIAKKLARELQATHISLDKLLKEHNLEGTNGIPLKNFLQSNKILVQMISEIKTPVIIDGCYYYQEQLTDLQEKLNYNINIISLVSDVDTCITRDAKREKTHGEASARYVHQITSQIKAGYEINTTTLNVKETLNKIKSILTTPKHYNN